MLKQSLALLPALVFASLLLPACGPGQVSTSTPIATSTNTSSPTSPYTASPAFAPTLTLTPTLMPTPGIGSLWVSPIDGMTMVFVPAGEFIMGDTEDQAMAECRKYGLYCEASLVRPEQPSHSVALDGYWIDQTEVTNAMYAKCVQAGKCNPPILESSFFRESYYGNPDFDDYPVMNILWNDAAQYCEWAGRRLPTEAEWEKAASWDETNEQKRIYPWGNQFPDCSLANYWIKDNECVGDTTKVGSYPPGASFYGALDMAGNVWEWVADWFDPIYYWTSPSSNPLGPETGAERISRGGSALDYGFNMRVAFRLEREPENSIGMGFRCARSE